MSVGKIRSFIQNEICTIEYKCVDKALHFKEVRFVNTEYYNSILKNLLRCAFVWNI